MDSFLSVISDPFQYILPGIAFLGSILVSHFSDVWKDRKSQDLSAANRMREIRLQRLVEDALPMMLSTWKQLIHAYHSVFDYISPIPSVSSPDRIDEELAKLREDAWASIMTINKSIVEHCFLFPKPLAEEIESIARAFEEVHGVYSSYKSGQSIMSREEMREQTFHRMGKEVLPRIKEVEDQLRDEMGVAR